MPLSRNPQGILTPGIEAFARKLRGQDCLSMNSGIDAEHHLAGIGTLRFFADPGRARRGTARGSHASAIAMWDKMAERYSEAEGISFYFNLLKNRNGGAEGDRTPDLCNAIAALSRLSYGPIVLARRRP